MKKVKNYIVKWLKSYAESNNIKGYVLGVSGGIDSAVVSTLVAETGLEVLVLDLPIFQTKSEVSRLDKHVKWLQKKYKNVSYKQIDLSNSFKMLSETLNIKDELTLANTKSRLRMTTIYAFANNNNYLVAGTGNKVEDFGIGFFTKGGDGQVDLSPIADLMKSEVYLLGEYLGIIQPILEAKPTDGLWENAISDEEQIGATYDELEWAMEWDGDTTNITERQKEVLNIYQKRHNANKHKMSLPPICKISKELKT